MPDSVHDGRLIETRNDEPPNFHLRVTRINSSIDQECGDVPEKFPKHPAGLGTETAFINRLIHQQHPAIAGSLSDREWSMAGAEGWMTSLLQVVLRTTKAKCEKHTQTLFCSCQIIRRIHRPQHVVSRNAAIEGGNQTLNAVCAEHCVEVVFGDRGIG
jgi:hypothetical protein